MSTTVSDFLLQRLSEWGIKRIFGFPGDGITGISAALDRAGERFDFVQVRHEEMAALMACAHAKFTGEIGICLATSGPGAIRLLNGLYDARLDHQPVVAIVGQQALSAPGGNFQQEADLGSLFKDVAGDYVHMAASPDQVRHLVDRAVRIARAERTVTCIIMPNDVQEMEAVEKPPRAHGTTHSGLGYSAPRVIPTEGDLRRAADALNAGKKVAALVGAGALTATEEVFEIADLLGAGVAKALHGKAAVPDDLPFVTGSIGLLGTRPSYDMMMDCDTLLMVGSRFPYSEFLPKEGQARGVQIDLDGKMLSIRYPMEVNLQGDSAATLRALIPLLERKKDRSWREKIEKSVAHWWKVLETRAMSGDPKFEASQDVPNFPYAKYAELLGLKGIFVNDPEQVGRAWEDALAADRPVVLEAFTDPNVPPLPPHISLKNAQAFMLTLRKGDPNELGIIRQSVREFVDEFLPHKG